jgi:hypothetical protein
MADTAYYVSPTGSDSNPGTLDAPFATLQRAQQAMENSSIKTTYILPGNYSPAGSANTPDGSGVLNLGSADSNETWSYYPPDGYGSANISGGGTITTFMAISGATGVTVSGLDISNFTSAGILVTDGSSNANINNNTIHDMSGLGITVDDTGSAVNNTVISNNYLYNIGSNAISVYSVHGNGNNNTTIVSNIIVNAATNVTGIGAAANVSGVSNPYADASETSFADSGDIYLQDLNPTASTGTEITNNYLGESHGLALYLDDGASNVNVTGNIFNPTTTAFGAIQIHGGDNDVFSGNIVDVSTGLIDGYLFYQSSDNPSGNRGMTGNVFEDNILVGDINSSGGSGYIGSLEPPVPLTIQNNDYWNYGSGGNLQTTGSDGAGNDSDPTYEDPEFTGGSYGSSYTIASGSPVFGSPVDFPGIVGGWGPPSSGTSPPPPPPPPPPGSTSLYGFYFVYDDQSYYFGAVADNGTYGYYVGETITTNNPYGGYYYIYGSAGATTDPVGSVYTKDYVDTTSGGQDYLSLSYQNGDAADGTSGLGSEFDYTVGANGQQAFGLGGKYEAMQGGNPAPPPPPPPPPGSSTTLYGFYFVYNDQSYYFGTVADNGTYGYYAGETIYTNNTYGGYYYIYGAEGTTTRPVGDVQTTWYVDTTSGDTPANGEGYTPTGLGQTDGTAGLGSEFDHTNGPDGVLLFGGGGADEARQGVSSPPPPPPPPSTTLYGFYFVYDDQSYYFGTVADNGTYGYYAGETIYTNNTYGGYYYIYGAEGTTTRPVGNVQTTWYVDTTSGDTPANGGGYTPTGLGQTDGTAGLGSEFDHTNGPEGLLLFGGGGVDEARQGNALGAEAIGDGAPTANLALMAQYATAGFATASDGSGTVVASAAPGSSDQPLFLTNPLH